MKILMAVHNISGQGTYRRAFPLARELARRGHQVTLIASNKDRRLGVLSHVESGVRLIESPDLLPGSFRYGWDPFNIIHRIAAIGNERFDIVHAFDCRPTVIYPALFARKHGARLVIDWADWFGKGGAVEERPNFLLRTLLRPIETTFEEHFRPGADANTVICSTLYQKALQLGVDPTRLIQFPNGCDTKSIHPEDRVEARRRLKLPLQGPYIGYVGSAFLGGAVFMAEVLKSVRLQFPEVRFLWIGARPKASRRILNELPDVYTPERVSEERLNDYLAACDLFWLPLRDTPANRGRWPLKFNDYLSAGRPVISTKVGDVKDFFNQKAIGWLTPDDAEQFASQTITALSDPIECNRRGNEARGVAETVFLWSKFCVELEILYKQAVML